ncbi:hypothetical protein J7M28_01815 [bacterium]|nr:hypothetical protein [bacterium]
MSDHEADVIGRIVDKLLESRKYRNIFRPALENVARWASKRYPRQREAEKAAKRKLHHVYGAYMTSGQLARVEELVKGIEAAECPDEKAVCREVLKCHASTWERLGHIKDMYRDIAEIIGQPRSVLELACGLNPFARPFMGLAPDASYLCIDIDCRLISQVKRFLARLPGRNEARCGAILLSVPADECDVVFLLKTLPCLERQEAGASLRILKALNATNVVVTFPRRSLSGRCRGMDGHYMGIMGDLINELGWEMSELRYPLETVYVLKTRAR